MSFAVNKLLNLIYGFRNWVNKLKPIHATYMLICDLSHGCDNN